nr:type VI secretion system ATPase TssH [Paraburkholderia monticola]
MKFPILLAAAVACSVVSFAAQAAITITGTRVIYPAKNREVNVRLNNVDSRPVLVQAWLDDGDAAAAPNEIKVPFTLLPSVFRVEPHRGQALRIMFAGGDMPTDRESVYWLNVLEIPPKPKDADERNMIQLAFRTRIKMFYRPASLLDDPTAQRAQLKWHVESDDKGQSVVRLTGDAGVGKTAVVEGLARAIAAGEVPPKLADVRLLSLDVGALLAGASMKGEFEARLKSVLEEAAKSLAPIVLFVDEIHTLIGAGGQAGTGDAANLLKPALARGTLRTIGATTWAEYKRHIEKDPALTRRFQVLQIAEPEEPSAIDMVRGLARTLARHHGVVVLDEAIRAAVTLSHRYIPSRQLPDKAISLLDTACARVALSQHAPPRELQRIRERLQAARVEAELLDNEARIGLGSESALADVNATIATLTLEERAIEAAWQAQSDAAKALASAREVVSERNADAGPRADGADSAASSLETLRELERTLSNLQAGTPLVFPEVGEAIVAEIVADWTGIPVGRMVTDEVSAVQMLPATLAARVIGQHDALQQIGERVQTARAGLADPRKPLGVFLLAGPSGVGKTETALALAEALYGGEQNLITINMSEYQEAHTVSGLKGAPPGYVGYGEGGVLTEAVRRRPYSVVLLDEIEKAHGDVHEMFYQVLDKGYMEDGDGRYIDFRNTTILMTSNVGSDLNANLCADEMLAPDMDGLRSALAPELLKAFPAAFLGRMTVVPYRPLGPDSLARIVSLHLDRVVRRMADNNRIVLSYAQEVVDYIVGRCLVQETGARLLIGFIEQHVLPRLAREWLDAFASKSALTHMTIEVADPAAAPADALVFQSSCLV